MGWLPAMAQQPGFISAAVVKPFADEELEALQAFKPEAAMEVVCFWRSEKERVEWVARPDPRRGVRQGHGGRRQRLAHPANGRAKLGHPELTAVFCLRGRPLTELRRCRPTIEDTPGNGRADRPVGVNLSSAVHLQTDWLRTRRGHRRFRQCRQIESEASAPAQWRRQSHP